MIDWAATAVPVSFSAFGLWLVLFASPLLPHLAEVIKGDLSFSWDSEELEARMLMRMASSEGFFSRVLHAFLHKIYTCRYCQAFHCSWLSILAWWAFFGVAPSTCAGALPAVIALVTIAALSWND